MRWQIAVALAALVLFFAKGTSLLASNPSFDDLFKQYAPSGIDWTILKRISWVESKVGAYPSVAHGIVNPSDVENSVSQDGLSWGLMQVTLATAQQFDSSATPQKLNNPEYSIMIAAKYLNWARNYLITYGNISPSNPRFVEFLVKSYNQGVGRTVKEINGIASSAADGYWNAFQNANV